jgi:AcrR family transcriptional regulator
LFDKYQQKLTFAFYTLFVKRNATGSSTRRRRPVQERAKVSVDAMLDASVKLLKRGGASSITTNRIAETAGVSIGSLYQYFPNKNALFVALHERHIGLVAEVMRRRITECEDAPLEHLVESLIDGMVEAHTVDPELSELLQSEVPHRADRTVEFSVRFHQAFRAALALHTKRLARKIDLETCAFVTVNMVEALGHAVALRRPLGLSLARAKAESCKAILAYLTS